MYFVLLFFIYYFKVQHLFILFFTLKYRGTTKENVLESKGSMKNILTFYIYDTIPVYFISMCCVAIFYTANICSVFYPVSISMHEMQFLILNINGDKKTILIVLIL